MNKELNKNFSPGLFREFLDSHIDNWSYFKVQHKDCQLCNTICLFYSAGVFYKTSIYLVLGYREFFVY